MQVFFATIHFYYINQEKFHLGNLYNAKNGQIPKLSSTHLSLFLVYVNVLAILQILSYFPSLPSYHTSYNADSMTSSWPHKLCASLHSATYNS